MPASSWSSSFPAAPTNGTPCLSSWKPGASPTNIRSAPGSPEPKTTCVRPPASAQRVHAATSSPYAWSSVAAATAPAATAAATTTESAGLPGGADHRERRQLARDVRRPALRARDLVVGTDQLLEVLLALHADVLVHRHRSGSLGPAADAGRRCRAGGAAELPRSRAPSQRTDSLAAKAGRPWQERGWTLAQRDRGRGAGRYRRYGA